MEMSLFPDDNWTTTMHVPHDIETFSMGNDFSPMDHDMLSLNNDEGENALCAANASSDPVWDAFNDTQEDTGDGSPYGSPDDHGDSDVSSVSLPSSPIHDLRRFAKLHALETLDEGDLHNGLGAEDFLVAPYVTLSLSPHLDAAMLLSLSLASRALHRRYGVFLKASATHRSVLSQFARAILLQGAWPVAHEFPRLFAETVHGSNVYYAGVRGFARNVYFLLATLPADKRHRYIRLLACGVVRGGHLAHVRSMVEYMGQTLSKAEIYDILAYPVDVIIPNHAMNQEERTRGETRGARALVDFLVTERNPDMGFVLELVGNGYVRMTTFATRIIVEMNRGHSAGAPANETVVSYGNHLIAAYLQTLKNHSQDACEACDTRALAYLWDNHDSNLVAFTVTEYHIAFIQRILASTNSECTKALKVETISRILDRCTHYNGVAVARAARILNSLCLFEMAFDTARARPSANVEYTQSQRLSAIVAIATAEQSSTMPISDQQPAFTPSSVATMLPPSPAPSRFEARLLPTPYKPIPRPVQQPAPTPTYMASPQMSPITPRPVKIVRPTSTVPSTPIAQPLKTARVRKAPIKYTSHEFIH